MRDTRTRIIVEAFDVGGPDKPEVTAAFFSPRFIQQGGDIARVLGRENYILRKDGVLVGLGSVAVSADEATLARLQVSEQHRGQGYGSELLDTIEGRLAQRGVHTMKVPMVGPQTADAAPFLEANGYSFMSDEAGDMMIPYMEKQLIRDAG